ncbi:MAG: alanine glycine permease, partial [Cyanobacteria bacterium P01_F01_bin.53]
MQKSLLKLRHCLYGLAVMLIFLPQVAFAQEAAPVGFLGAIEAGVQSIVDVLNRIFYFKVGGE